MDQGYDVAQRIKVIPGRRLLLDWEEAPHYFGHVSGLIRPGSYRAAHYTGIVIGVGLECSDDVHVGDRVFFDQFCSPLDWQEGERRFAFINESDALALIPPREEMAELSVKLDPAELHDR